MGINNQKNKSLKSFLPNEYAPGTLITLKKNWALNNKLIIAGKEIAIYPYQKR